MKGNHFFSNDGTNLHTIIFFCNTPYHSKNGFSCFHKSSKHGCRHNYCAVICDIDRAINKYTFFGNGGANLHTNLFVTRYILFSHIALFTFCSVKCCRFLRVFSKLDTPIRSIFPRVHGNHIFRQD